MSTSEVKICNQALSMIGSESRISALGEEGRAGEQCELWYETARDTVLAAHPWNFAISRAELSRDASSPDFEFTYQYLLPDDYIRALELYNSEEDWRIENYNGNLRLLTNETTVQLKYISRVTNPNLFSPLFISTLVRRLGIDLSNVTAGTKKISEDEFEAFLKEAKRRDGQEGTPGQIVSKGPANFKNGLFK